MIVYDLKCSTGHRFEGWFGSAEDFAAQKDRQLLTCPACADGRIERMPSPTRINIGATEKAPVAEQPVTGDALALAQKLYSQMLDDLLTKSEDVGTDFPEEARRIFYEQAPGRAIRGVATSEEHEALVDEGIPVARLPIPPKKALN
jgi:hypothetical protein